MKKTLTSPFHPAALKRRELLALGLSALAGCGGGVGGSASGGNTASLPGTGGTGIGVQGAITGFGSVIVNGVKYDDSAATVQMDGQPSSSSNLRVGMVAWLVASKNTTTTGTTSSVDIWSVAQGSGARVIGSGALTLAGMTIQTDSGTSYSGCANFAGLSAIINAATPSYFLTIWGIQASADASRWVATRVQVAPANRTAMVTTGLVTLSGGQPTVNGLSLSGSGVSTLQTGQLVRLEGVSGSATNSLVVSSIKVMNASSTQNQADEEVEGLVTAFNSATDFVVGALQVNAAGAQVSLENGARLALGSRVEVQGALVNGVLNASAVEVKSSSSVSSVGIVLDISGPIQNSDNAGKFEVRGQKCDAAGVTLGGGHAFSDLINGTNVRVKGTSQGDETLVLSQLTFL